MLGRMEKGMDVEEIAWYPCLEDADRNGRSTHAQALTQPRICAWPHTGVRHIHAQCIRVRTCKATALLPGVARQHLQLQCEFRVAG
jgi:hypothetical protein